LGNDLIKKQFDDIDGKIDFMIELCRSLQLENNEMTLTIEGLKAELDRKKETEEEFSKQETLVQSKIDGLLEKLNHFSNGPPGEHQSNL